MKYKLTNLYDIGILTLNNYNKPDMGRVIVEKTGIREKRTNRKKNPKMTQKEYQHYYYMTVTKTKRKMKGKR